MLSSNQYLIIFSYLPCQEINLFIYLFPKKLKSLLKKTQQNCRCNHCTLSYWIKLSEYHHFNENINPNSYSKEIYKLCAKKSKLSYIKGLHYRLVEPYQFYTNYR